MRAHSPDARCLQEIKMRPRASFRESTCARSATHIAVAGQKGYHGVATLSRLPFTLQERRDICGRGHARHLSVRPDATNAQAKPVVLQNTPCGGPCCRSRA